MTDKLYLKNIYDLLGENFFIPAYQRGYRWASIQVKELLDDIWEFSNSGKSSFYCLQPVVVVKEDTYWEVVDGQQRLTTLYLILHYLEQEHLRRPLADAYKKNLYTIQYETRPESETFLKAVHEAADLDNIDYYHMRKAYEAIVEWFSEKDYNDNNVLLSTLLEKTSESKSVKVIWYDLSSECEGNDYAIDVFSRINIGKIPLTNAELVKALFLQSSHFQKGEASLRQLHIASEWDAIEQRLQESEFWHFIYRTDIGKKYPTRIEYIFDLMKGKKTGDETFFTFHKFNEDFKNGNADIDSLWKGVKDYFLTFEEWYGDRDLYHLIGFLVDCGESVARIKSQSASAGLTKTDFKAFLKSEIRKKVNFQLDELSYGDTRIKKLLLLFNIQTLLKTKEADVRFPFDRYKRESWDIEHIRSQTDTVLQGVDRYAWLKDVLEYFESQPLSKDTEGYVDKIASLLKDDKLKDEVFEELHQSVCDYFDEGEASWIDGLGNLALLDAATNRSYKNALFPIKRARIIQNDMLGVFVPICTKNVFLKFYSKSSGDFMYWRESDSEDYLAAIYQVLKEYLPLQGDSNE